MKNLIKKILFSTLGAFLYFVFPLIIKFRKEPIYVLNYHSTYPDKNNNFVKQILFFKKYFDFIDEKFLLDTNKKMKFQKPKLLITFDDAHISNFNVVNILDKYKIPAIFFVPYGFVDRKIEKSLIRENKITNEKFNIISNLDKDKENNYKSLSMSFQNLKKLINKNYSVGAHGYSHIRLSENLTYNQLSKEIILSKKLLEKKLDTKINSFCWTFGDQKSYSQKASNIIKKNYKLSFMTCCKPFNFNQNKFNIHRFNIENFFSVYQIAFVLSGIYELLYTSKRNFVNNITK